MQDITYHITSTNFGPSYRDMSVRYGDKIIFNEVVSVSSVLPIKTALACLQAEIAKELLKAPTIIVNNLKL